MNGLTDHYTAYRKDQSPRVLRYFPRIMLLVLAVLLVLLLAWALLGGGEFSNGRSEIQNLREVGSTEEGGRAAQVSLKAK